MHYGSHSDRRYELDWLRVFAIFLLLFFHTARVFDLEPWHIKNSETSGSGHMWMTFLQKWRMPLLFFISGAGSNFAFRNSTTFRFVTGRFKRLLIPFICGLILVLPPQTYYEHQEAFDNYGDLYASLYTYIPFHNGSLNLYHLWFIAYLFVYSIIATPLLAFLRSGYSDFFKKRILRVLYHPLVLLLVPVIFIAIPRIVLLPGHGGRAHFLFFFSFFLLGMVYYLKPAYRDLISAARKYSLFAALISLPLFGLTSSLAGLIGVSDSMIIDSLRDVAGVCVSWFWVITFIGYGQHYFNYSKPWLGLINEGSYPFYILHQTVIVVIGYYICQLPWSIAAKFWSISLLTLVSVIGFYLVFIRPFNWVRFIFGMKPKRQLPAVVQVDREASRETVLSETTAEER